MFQLTRDQFARSVIEIVRARFPLAKIARAEQPFSIRINGRLASLENLYRIALLRPDDVQRQVERWAIEMVRASEGTPDESASLDQLRDRILPMVISRQSDEGNDRGLIGQPLVAGLWLTYVIDGDRTIAYLPERALHDWGVSLDAVHELAIANLVKRSESMPAHAAEDDQGRITLVLFQTLDGYDAARLVLPTLHDRLRQHLGSPFAAAVPNRDILLCFRNEPESVARLRKQIAEDFRTMPHQISDKLVLVTADGLAAYD
jgi:hypothetical protein